MKQCQYYFVFGEEFIGPVIPTTQSIKTICELLLEDKHEEAKGILKSEYPFILVERVKRKTLSAGESMDVFLRDGFIDRYSGSHLVFPGSLRLIHRLLPSEFPFHTNWKMSETHMAFWELLPTIDHVVPVARGGTETFDNWVSTSQLRNSIKSNWLLEEIGWDLKEPGNLSDWDGLTSWFIQYVDSHSKHLTDPYIKRWYSAALPHFKKQWIHVLRTT